MPHVELAGPPNLRHSHLRSALQFAVDIAEQGQRLRPPLASPPELKAFFRLDRLPSSALGRVRRIVEGDEVYRTNLGVSAVAELVDELGLEWLRREAGWEQRVAAMIVDAERAESDEDAARVARREERRRRAAEEAAVRTRAELASVKQRLHDTEQALVALRQQHSAESSEAGDLRQQLAAARQRARHAGDRASADRAKLEHVEAELDEAVRRVTAAERQRDQLLLARAELPGGEAGLTRIAELRELAAAARRLADRLGTVVGAGPPRQPVDVPLGLAKDPRKVAEHMLGVAGVLVLVDGYNVSKLTWPDLSLEEQRGRTLDAVDAVARRYAAEIVVVFDGADVVGAHAARRRLARVRYSPAGVSADDVIRREVEGVDPARAVVVVTNDAAIRRDVTAAGANVVASATFAELALR